MKHTLKKIIKGHGTTLTAVAKSLNVHKSTVSRWKQLPAERLIETERVTGIPRQKLRPDLFAGISQ